MVAGRPQRRQGGAEHEIPVARGMDDVVVGSCQLHAERGPAAPATGAATAAKVRTWLGAARIALDEATVAQAVVQHNSIRRQQLAQLVPHHPSSELAMLDIFLGRGLFTRDDLALALLQPCAAVGNAAHSTLHQHAGGSLVNRTGYSGY